MKRILAIATLMLTLLVTGCGPLDGILGKGNVQTEEFVLKAVVKSITDSGQIEVEVIESDYAFGIYYVHTRDAVFLDKDGRKISVSDIRAGDRIEITYGGQVMMSYPPQIVACKIKKV